MRGPLNVLIATTFDLDEYVCQALRNGARGFLLKDMSPAQLVEAVRAVTPEPAPTEPLTERETAVVKLVAQGHTNEEIAAQLYVAAATVKTHLANIQRKLTFRNRVEIAAWAWRTGLAR